jgi:hypothetical protein
MGEHSHAKRHSKVINTTARNICLHYPKMQQPHTTCHPPCLCAWRVVSQQLSPVLHHCALPHHASQRPHTLLRLRHQLGQKAAAAAAAADSVCLCSACCCWCWVLLVVALLQHVVDVEPCQVSPHLAQQRLTPGCEGESDSGEGSRSADSRCVKGCDAARRSAAETNNSSRTKSGL